MEKIFSEVLTELATRVKCTPRTFHFDKKYTNQIILVTDSNLTKGGGFIMIKSGKEKMKFFFAKDYIKFFDTLDPKHGLTHLKLFISSTDAERTTLLKFLRLHQKKLATFSYGDTQILVLTDSLPLMFQVETTSNKNALTNAQISEIRAILDELSCDWSIKWHSRNTTLGRLGDSISRENEVTPTEFLIKTLKKFFGLKNLEMPIAQEKISRINVVEPEYIVQLHDNTPTTKLYFPHPMISNKQIQTFLTFLKLRQAQGYIGIPKIDKLKHFWHREPQTLTIPLVSQNFQRLKSLSQKNFKIIFFPFNFTIK